MTCSGKYLRLVALSLLALFSVHCIDIGNSGSSKSDGGRDSSASQDARDVVEQPRDADTPSDTTPKSDSVTPADADADAHDAHDADTHDAVTQPDADTTPSFEEDNFECTPTDTSQCVTPANALAAGCVLGRCSFDCAPGFVDLDGDLSQPDTNGCEYACEPTNGGVEICDGLDNNCDGTVDEGFSGIGDTCTEGLGICAATGVMVCAPDGSAVICDAVAGTPREEVCNGLDDDCNGEVDDGMGSIFYEDRDGDHFGSTATGPRACDFARGFTLTVGGDCDDNDRHVHPEAAPRCNTWPDTTGSYKDYNCNGKVQCQEEVCAGEPCITHTGVGGMCSLGTCTRIPMPVGECTQDFECGGINEYCDCLPGPGVCCRRGMLCPCMIEFEPEEGLISE